MGYHRLCGFLHGLQVSAASVTRAFSCGSHAGKKDSHGLWNESRFLVGLSPSVGQDVRYIGATRMNRYKRSFARCWTKRTHTAFGMKVDFSWVSPGVGQKCKMSDALAGCTGE